MKRPAPASSLLYPTNLIACHQPAAELGRVGVLPPAPELRSPQPQLRLLSDTTWLTFQQISSFHCLKICTQSPLDQKTGRKVKHSYWFSFGFPISSAIPTLSKLQIGICEFFVHFNARLKWYECELHGWLQLRKCIYCKFRRNVTDKMPKNLWTLTITILTFL